MIFLSSFGIVAFPDDRGLVAALFEMPVDAVEAGVERAVLEPFDRDVARRVGGVLHLGEGLDPVMRLACSPQNLFGSLDRARVHLLVLGVVDLGALLPVSRNVVDLVVGHRIPPAARFTARPYSSASADYDAAALTARQARAGLPLWSEFSGLAASQPTTRADDQQHAEPMAGVDRGQLRAAAGIGVVDRDGGQHEAEPDRARRR